MNQINEATATQNESATTERKPGRSRRGKGSADSVAQTRNEINHAISQGAKTMNMQDTTTDILNEKTHAKFVLFAIPKTEQVAKGPIMRGIIEVKTEDTLPPVKVNVAAWLKISPTTGTEYLSLKVGNNSQDDPEDYTVGPFYGRLFRQVEGTRTRYFGLIEDAEKTGENESGQAMYATHWQIRVNAKPAVSNDGRTRYISGQVTPSQHQEEVEDNHLPF